MMTILWSKGANHVLVTPPLDTSLYISAPMTILRGNIEVCMRGREEWDDTRFRELMSLAKLYLGFSSQIYLWSELKYSENEKGDLSPIWKQKNVGMPWRGCSFKSCLLGLPHYKEGSLEVQEGMILITNIFHQSFHQKPWSLAYVVESGIPYKIPVNSEWSELILNNVRIFGKLLLSCQN
jgi:hypothetical protein